MFLERLDLLLVHHNINVRKLLAELNINHNAYNNWEKRGTVPGGDTLVKLADYFNVSIDYLLGRTGNPDVNR
jgi:transcriptional regulator with XRE-family HTH domain